MNERQENALSAAKSRFEAPAQPEDGNDIWDDLLKGVPDFFKYIPMPKLPIPGGPASVPIIPVCLLL